MNDPRFWRRRDSVRSSTLRSFLPHVELVERRQLLAGNFLQGFALAANNVPLSGATITLYSLPSDVQVGAPVTTGSDGGYLFSGLGAGQYRLVETPPSGFANVSAQFNSQLNPATASTASSVDVTIGDPTGSSTPSWFLNTTGSNKEAITFTASNPFVSTPTHTSEVGSLSVNVNETDIPFTTPTFSTFCVDLNRSIFPPPYGSDSNLPYSIEPLDQALASIAGTSEANSGRIAYLFNTFGQAPLTTSQSAGLQLAIWELEFDPSPTDVTSGAFHVAAGTDPAAITAAQGYLADSVGQNAKAVYLNGLPSGSNPTGTQGLIATGTFNFYDTQTQTQLVSLNGFDYLVPNTTPPSSLTPATTGVPIPGTTVTLTGTDVFGNPVSETTTTNTSGFYNFPNLNPSNSAGYTVTETPPAADTHLGQTSTTPGAITNTPPGTPPVVSNIVLTTANSPSTDNFFEIVPSTTPGLTIVKSATVNSNSSGDTTSVTYGYVVTNTGTQTLTNVKVTDDEGIPNNPNPVVVGTIASLAPGASNNTLTLTVPVYSSGPLGVPVPLSELINGVDTPIGTLTTTLLTSGPFTGDYQVVFNQSLGIVDNTYGTNASAGWGTKGHTFNDLVGSDQAEFQFTDGLGNVVLQFDADYVSKATSATFAGGTVSYPSGYGTLGQTGGDGKLITGSGANILKVDTTITDNLNQSPAFYGFTTNSPTPGSAADASWNNVDGYTVIVSPAAFGSNGFGGVTIPFVHDSPSKISGIIKFFPQPQNFSLTNTATATATAGTGTVTATSQATADIEFPPLSTSPGSPGKPAPAPKPAPPAPPAPPTPPTPPAQPTPPTKPGK